MTWRSRVKSPLLLWGLIAALLAPACGDDRNSPRRGGDPMDGGASGSAGATPGGRTSTGGGAGDGADAADGGSAGTAPDGRGGTGGGAGDGTSAAGSGRDPGGAGEGGAAGEDVGPPPSLPQCAGPLDRTVPSTMFEMARCLFEGEDAPQRELTSGIIEPKRVAVLRGRVLDDEGAPLAGVMVSVWNHPEFGHTLSRSDGHYDLAANGGGQLTLRYERDGYLAARRQLATRWREFSMFPDVVLLERAPTATEIDLDTEGVNVVEGEFEMDARGERQQVLLFQPNTEASLKFPDGRTEVLSSFHVRVREYTVGELGPQAMPADLPANSGYTYAVSYTVDEAEAAGATQVEFSPPAVSYLDNFLDFPAGTLVPSGYYDSDSNSWKPDASGIVLDILAVDGDRATIDSDGDGDAEPESTLAELGIGADELRVLANRYEPGQSLWRVLTPHFSAWDWNWPIAPPFDAEPPNAEITPSDDGGCQSLAFGSIIGCEHQTLGEVIPLSGTPFALRYQSERTTGRLDAQHLKLRLSPSAVPPSLKRIDVEITIAGQRHWRTYSPSPNATATFDWDGKDAFGRVLQGRQRVVARIGYVYAATYEKTVIFGYNGNGVPITGNAGRDELTLWAMYETYLGTVRAEPLGFGGWTVDQNHILDLSGQTVFLGTGEQLTPRRLGNPDVITTVVGPGSASLEARGDGGPATLAFIDRPRSVVVAPDGSLFVAEGNFIRKVAPDGIISTYAGTGVGGISTGDGGPATEASVSNPVSLALAPDGTLYVAGYYRVRAISPDGIIRTVAGNGVYGSNGDDGPALDASIDPSAIALGPDGSLYIADPWVVRRVGPDGIISRFAGNGDYENSYPPSGEGGPAVDAKLGRVSSLAVGPGGEVYISGAHPDVVRRVDPDGAIWTVSGAGDGERLAEGVPARGVYLLYPGALSVAADGTVFFASAPNQVFAIPPSGLLRVVVGENSVGPSGDVGDDDPARHAYLQGIPYATAIGPDGALYVADTEARRVRRIGPVFPSFAPGLSVVPSGDARQLFVFDALGRHLHTLDAATQVKLLEFAYEDAGRLASATDRFGNTTEFRRDDAGALTRIVGPFGESTEIELDANGYLASVTNANDETAGFVHSAYGLLRSTTSPREASGVHLFDYDSRGRLTSDREASGSRQDLRRVGDSYLDFDLTLTSWLGVTQTLKVRDPDKNTVVRTLVDAAGVVADARMASGVSVVSSPTRTVTSTLSGDPRFGMQAPVLSSRSIRLAGANAPTLTIEEQRSATLAQLYDPLSATVLERTVLVNGLAWRETWNAADSTLTLTSPEGRQTVQTLDERGLVDSVQTGDLLPITFEYERRGNLVAGRQGEREWMFEYDPGGYLAATENAVGERSTFVRDSVGRPLEVERPDGEVLSATFDLNGNLTALSPPGRPEHRLEYGLSDALLAYIPPATAGDASLAFSYDYNEDDQLALVTFPGGGEVTRTYDGAGRLSEFGADGELTTLTYDTGTGLLASLAGESETLTFSYTGDLVTGVTWSGVVSGSVTSTIDAFFRSTTESVGSDPIEYSYDNDGLLTAAGAAQLTRDPESGSITLIELGQLTSTTEYNELGETSRLATSFGSSAVYAVELVYDALGRIDTRVETVQGATHTDSYEYDDDGRLVVARRGGAVRGTYAYDENGNRTSATDDTGSRTATHDQQDRLLTDGNATFTYSAEGALLTRKVGSSTTTYRYDLLGALREVELPDSRHIEYVVDGTHRRIGKRIDGSLEQAFLYRNDLNIVAELDGSGALISRFVYGSRPHVPDYMVKAGVTYRFVTDERGSVRLLLDSATGAVAQRIDYDVWGNVTADTNPGFQPFGFAGGLYDHDTSLVRFGARDYDPSTGRWTAKDPLVFGGGQSNLYAYVGNDPLNFVDPSGHYGWFAGALAGAAIGGGLDLAVQLAMNGGSFDCVDWGQVGVSAAMGALGVGKLAGAGGEATIQVSRWGRPGLQPGDWVMPGGVTPWNYLRSFKWQPGLGNQYASFRSGQSFSVPRASVVWPKGWGIDGYLKGLFGQRRYVPAPGAPTIPPLGG
jgi:RHS repeat-associated protein